MNGCHIKPEQFFNLIFGYYDSIGEDLETISTGAALTDVNATPVPAGEIWVVQLVTARHSDPTARRLLLRVVRSALEIVGIDTTTVATTVTITFPNPVVLVEDDILSARGVNVASGSRVYLDYIGYKMKVA